MRLRHIPGSEEAVKNSNFVISDPASHRGRFDACFGNSNPLETEIGMGKGKFIMEMAIKNPGINYIGVERYASVLLHALKKREEEAIPNLLFMCVSAQCLNEIFSPGEISRIYLNFPDPWPKEKHAKRRLTSPGFLQIYDYILKDEGILEFKTDNMKLFDESLSSFKNEGWEILAETRDLYHSELLNGNIATEYETRFSEQGKCICKLIVRKGNRKNA